MKKLLLIMLILIVICVAGCGNEKTAEQPASETEKSIAKVIAEKKALHSE